MNILVVVGFLIWIYVSFGWLGIVLSIALVALAIYFQNIYETSKQDAEIKYSQTRIKPHLDELVLKREQLSYDDGYGLTNRSKWEKEKKKFAHNILKGSKLTDAQISNVIETLVDERSSSISPTSSFLLNKSNSPNLEKNLSTHKIGIDYESECAKILSFNNWIVKRTKASGDQGADLVVNKRGTTVVIQCKKYKKPVGNKAVQEVHAAKEYYEANYGVVVSNGTYTVSAKQLANKLGVHLLHHDELSNLDKIIKSILD